MEEQSDSVSEAQDKELADQFIRAQIPALRGAAGPGPERRSGGSKAHKTNPSQLSVRLPQLMEATSDKPSAVIEHLRTHYANYLVLGSSMKSAPVPLAAGAPAALHSGVAVLFQELLHNSIDEYLQGHGKVIDVLCSTETITIRDYGRGIPHPRLRAEIQELGQNQKFNSPDLRYCEGLSGLGLKLVNALSSRFLLRSYRVNRFAEIETAQGRILRDRRGRCNKEDGTFIRFTPDPGIFAAQSVSVAKLFDVLCKVSALFPGLEIRLNQTHVIKQKGVGDLFQSLPQWRKLNYLYGARSLSGRAWQLGFAHLSEWQNNDGGLHNERLVQSFVNGHACAGGISGGLHVRQLQGAFLGALREVFPDRVAQVNAFWDKGITLFWSLSLVEPSFQDLGKTQLTGAESEVSSIALECRQQLCELFERDGELKTQLEKLLGDCEAAEERDEYNLWQSRLSGELLQTEERTRQLEQTLENSEHKYNVLNDDLHTAREESEEMQKHWKDVSSQLVMDMEQAENDLNEFKKLQRAEQRRYRKEQEKRLQNLEEEQQLYQKLKDGVREQTKELLNKESQRQQLIDSGLNNWNSLQKSLEEASTLQKQRDLEQEQILDYLRGAKASTETEVGIVQQNIKLAEQKMLQRQEAYLKNLQDNAREEFDTIHDEIDSHKQELRKVLTEEQRKADEKLEVLHKRLDKKMQLEDRRWQEQLEQAGKSSAQEWQQSLNRRRDALERLDQNWREQEAVLEEQRQKQRSFIERWRERLVDGRREVQAHQDAQRELVRNRKELQEFFEGQKRERDDQARKWQDWLEQNRKELAENQELTNKQLASQYEAQKEQQEDWDRRINEQGKEMETLRSRQLEALESLGTRLEREVEQEVQRRLKDWLKNMERLGREGEEHFIVEQKLLQTKQQTLENELALVQQEKDKLWQGWTQELEGAKGEMARQLEEKQTDWRQKQEALQSDLEQVQSEKEKLWSQWQRDFGNAKEEMTCQLARRKEEWERRQETLLQEFERHLESLKQKQYAQQHRIEETQTEQMKTLKQLQQCQRDADERMGNLNKDLLSYTAELRKEIETSMAELRNNTDHQFAQVEQCAQDQALLYQQGLLEREQESRELLDKYRENFDQKLEQRYQDMSQWSESFVQRFDEQKQALRESLEEFGKGLKEEQEANLIQELESRNDKFRAEQSGREKQAAQEAQRKRNQFWREQQLDAQQEAQQQRQEFQDLHKQLHNTMERERERVQKELDYLQQLAQQQEESLESLSQSLARDVEQRSEHLKKDMEENYRQFHEEILGNTRELHQMNSEERKTLRDDLAKMQSDVKELNANIGLSEQALQTVQKALPDSLKLQESLDKLAGKEKLLHEVEREITQLQSTLNENSQIGQKTSEQLAALLARRNELSDIEQQMGQILNLSGDLYQQRESLDQQQKRVAGYQNQLDKLEHLYKESSDLLELFDERKNQMLEAASLLNGYSEDLGKMDEKIQVLQEQLQPLELSFGKAQDLQQELVGQQQQLQSTQEELEHMQQALGELHEDSQGIDKMRDWIAKTETRMLELSQDIQENLRTVETIVRKNRPGERNSHSGLGKVDNDVRNTVVQLYNKNWISSEIARATQLSVGEVELILEMLPSAS